MLSSRELNKELSSRYEEWLVTQNYKPNTRVGYAYAVQAFSDFMGAKAVTQSTHFDIQEYLFTLAKKGARARTVRAHLYALRIFFDFLSMGRLVQWVTPRMVQAPKIEYRLPPILTESQIGKILGAVRDLRERTLIEVFYGTGCRTGELVNMKVEDVDFKVMRVRVSGKYRPRFLMFGRPVARALRRYIGNRTTGFVFIDNRRPQRLNLTGTSTGAWYCRWRKYDEAGKFVGFGNGAIPASRKVCRSEAIAEFSELMRPTFTRRVGLKPLHCQAVERNIRNIGARVGITLYPYLFRHSFATHLLDHGADVRAVQEFLGHTRLNTTQVYTRISKGNLRRTFDRCHPRAH